MPNNISNISQRINDLVIHFTNGNNSKFAAIIKTSEANIRNYIKGTTPKFDVISAIASSFEINYEWLLTGKGQMLSAKSEQYPIDKDDIAHLLVNDTEAPLLKTKSTGIPLVSTEALGGFGNMEFVIKDQDIQNLYEVPDFVNVDFMIRVKGSSMYPKYNSGDVVACRIIRESKFIQWNKVHIVATTEQGILIKRLKKAENTKHFIAVSDNKDYDPFEIPKEEITGVALVLGVIRLE